MSSGNPTTHRADRLVRKLTASLRAERAMANSAGILAWPDSPLLTGCAPASSSAASPLPEHGGGGLRPETRDDLETQLIAVQDHKGRGAWWVMAPTGCQPVIPTPG